MSQPRVLQNQFLGFQRDKSRDQLPQGYCYDLLNVLPDMEAPIRKRGGWTTEGPLLTSLNASAGFPARVAYAPFQSTAPQVVAIDDTLFRIFDVTNSVDRGASGLGAAPLHTPVFYNDLLIFTDGINPPKKYDGAAAGASLSGTPPSTPRCIAVYKDRLLLSGANSSASEMRKIYFSAAGNPDSWDTTNRWIATSSPVQGIAALRNALIVFHAGSVERIRGDIPPGSSAANMVLEPLFNEVGLYEPNSFAVSDDSVVWADEDGVYLTDGASISDLTKQGGIKKYWAEQVAALSGGTIAVGYWKGYAFVSMVNQAGNNSNTLMCNIQTRGWYRHSRVFAKNFSGRFGSTDELYFSNQLSKRVGDLSTIFAQTPTSSPGTDGDGGSFSASVETGYITAGTTGKKRFRSVYATYDLSGSGPPTMEIQFITQPYDTSYEVITTQFPATSGPERKRLGINRAALGLALLLTPNGTGAPGSPDDWKLYSIDADIYQREGSRR